ncbi:MAG: hypothetical protein H8E44_13405 [Planctomycetes bacterium]|nr:hypothetical protein [Planctomycetota bacterium]MBL7039132.1 hypothetical protein [Pirellulaceae bacterium]
MTTSPILCIAIGLGLVLCGGATLWRQRRAKSCPKHSRSAGLVAMVFGYLAIGVGIAVVLAVWWLI